MLDEGTATRNALQIADEVAQLGASLTTGSSMDATTVSGAVAGEELRRDAQSDGRRRAAAVVPGRGDRAAARRAARPARAAARQPGAGGGTGHGRGALRRPSIRTAITEIGTEASVKAIDARRHGGVLEAELRAEQRRARRGGRHLDDRAAGAGGEGVRRAGSAARRRGRRSAPPTTTRRDVVIVDKPGAPQTQVRVAAIGAPRSSPDFRPMQVMNMALGGLFSSRINMNLREKNGYTLRRVARSSCSAAAPGPFQVAGGVRTDVTAPAVTEIFKEIRGMVEKPMTAEELQQREGRRWPTRCPARSRRARTRSAASRTCSSTTSGSTTTRSTRSR